MWRFLGIPSHIHSGFNDLDQFPRPREFIKISIHSDSDVTIMTAHGDVMSDHHSDSDVTVMSAQGDVMSDHQSFRQ